MHVCPLPHENVGRFVPKSWNSPSARDTTAAIVNNTYTSKGVKRESVFMPKIGRWINWKNNDGRDVGDNVTAWTRGRTRLSGE